MLSFILNKFNKIKFFPYYFLSPTPYALGTAAIEIFISLNNLKKKKIIILNVDIFNKILKYKNCNNSLFKDLYEDKYIYHLPFLYKNILIFFLSIEFFIKRSFVLITCKFFKLKYKDYDFFLDIGLPLFINFRNDFENNFEKLKFDNIQIKKKKLTLYINKNKSIFLKKKLNDYIFFKNRPYVVLHVRDGNYRNDSKYRPWRNSEINNYAQSVDYLISKGFSVIKIGDVKSKKINYEHKFFFDYSRSDLRSDVLDLYLIKNCSFLIGTISGPNYLASLLFSKPVLNTNVYVINFLFNSNNRILFKKIFYKRKEISIIEYLNLPFEMFHEEYEHKEISFRENTSFEILESTKEFYRSYNANFKTPGTLIQERFNKLLFKRCSIFFSKEAKDLKNIDPLWVIYSMKFYKSYYCDIYLKKHFKKFKFTDE